MKNAQTIRSLLSASPLIPLGLVLLVAAFVMYLFQSSSIQYGSGFMFEDEALLVWVNHTIAVAYFVMVLVRTFAEHKWRLGRMNEIEFTIALMLYSIGAHTLNTVLPVFTQYTTWFGIAVAGMHIALMAYPFRDLMPRWMKHVSLTLLGASILISLYLSAFILPLMPVCLAVFFALGLPLYALAPAWYVIAAVVGVIRLRNDLGGAQTHWFGFVALLIVLFGFTVRWRMVQKMVEDTDTYYWTEYTGSLPEWALLAQKLPDDPFTEHVIFSQVFAQRSIWEDNFNFGLIENQELYNQHEPFAIITRWIYGETGLEEDVVINMLNARYDARHLTHRRLWDGDKLTTQSVQTDVEIFPEYRIAYTEKVISIRNQSNSNNTWRDGTQEAVYSFYMPEGAVVTSLSLWIEGEERKSRLTTKSKADSAYVEIVGVEVRDPALLHWQEGNRVTVTVFPCTPEEDRKFKVGFTVPLREEEGRLHWENIYFDGPARNRTKEQLSVRFTGTEPQNLDKPWAFRQKDDKLLYKGRYNPAWSLSMDAVEIPNESFSFQGKRIQAKAFDPKPQSFDPQVVVVDMNAAWQRWEWEEVWNHISEKEVYIYLLDGKQQVTEDNKWELFREATQLQFTLVPFHLIKNPSETLIISKSPRRSPALEDIEDTQFARDLSLNLAAGQQFPFFNISPTISPYLKSMKEFRVLKYAEGRPEALGKSISEGKWDFQEEAENAVILRQADMVLLMDSTESEGGNAPNHLFRLYAYNDLMKTIGPAYFEREALEDVWVRKAEEGFVVSPISSLIVLETQKDYERFGIDENENSLGNAAIGASGAVPEPHEWLLIAVILGLIVMRWLRLRR